MTASSSGTTRATEAQTKDTDSDVEYLRRRARELQELTTKAREHLGYLARNMDDAFAGALTHIEANAYCALAVVLGILVDIDEEASSLKGHADSMAYAARKAAKAAKAAESEVAS